jgi:hypothetical protein
MRRIFPDRLCQTNSVAAMENLPLKYSPPKQEHRLTPYWMIVSIYHREILLQNNYLDHHHLPMNLLSKLSRIRASQSRSMGDHHLGKSYLCRRSVIFALVSFLLFEFDPSETLAAHYGIRGSRFSWMGGISPRGNEPRKTIKFGR